MTFHHPAPDRRQQAGDLALGALLRHRFKRFLQGQTRLNQGRQLQGQQRQFRRTQAARCAAASPVAARR